MSKTNAGIGETGRFEIRTQGHIDARWSDWFDGLELRPEADGTTVIVGPALDQAALHGVLAKVRDLGLALISVTSTPQPDDTRGSTE